MLQLNLKVYDDNHSLVDGLSVDNAAPQHINAVLMFLKPNWTFEVTCENISVEVSPSKNV